jgi:hypothetical protein
MNEHMYILDAEGNPVPEPDLMKWGEWNHEWKNRVVRQDYFGLPQEEIMVSTVFMGLDHNFSREGPPVLWETMVFGGPYNDYTERYTSKAEGPEGPRTRLCLGGPCTPAEDSHGNGRGIRK